MTRFSATFETGQTYSEPSVDVMCLPAEGLFAVLEGMTGNAGPRLPLAAARRAIQRFFATPRVAGEAQFRQLLKLLSNALIQVEHTAYAIGYDAAATQPPSDGTGDVPDRSGASLGFGLEIAIVWVSSLATHVSSIGTCGVFSLGAEGARPLRQLDRPPMRVESLRWACTRILPVDEPDVMVFPNGQYRRLALLSTVPAVAIVDGLMLAKEPGCSGPLEGASRALVSSPVNSPPWPINRAAIVLERGP